MIAVPSVTISTETHCRSGSRHSCGCETHLILLCWRPLHTRSWPALVSDAHRQRRGDQSNCSIRNGSHPVQNTIEPRGCGCNHQFDFGLYTRLGIRHGPKCHELEGQLNCCVGGAAMKCPTNGRDFRASLVTELRKRKSFLSTGEMIELISRGRNTICRWVRNGTLPAKLIGNGYEFDPHEIADWLEGREV